MILIAESGSLWRQLFLRKLYVKNTQIRFTSIFAVKSLIRMVYFSTAPVIFLVGFPQYNVNDNTLVFKMGVP